VLVQGMCWRAVGYVVDRLKAAAHEIDEKTHKHLDRTRALYYFAELDRSVWSSWKMKLLARKRKELSSKTRTSLSKVDKVSHSQQAASQLPVGNVECSRGLWSTLSNTSRNSSPALP